MALNYHMKNVKAIIENSNLSSFSNKNDLRDEYKLIGGEHLEKYGYNCRICGSKSMSALNGMKYFMYNKMIKS